MHLLQNFHLAVIEYLYRVRRAVHLQTYTTRYSNRKLSIVKDLSITITQCALETTKFGKITQNKGHFAVRGHSRSTIFLYDFLLVINTNLPPILHRFGDTGPKVKKRYRLIWLPPCVYSPRRRCSTGTISVKFFLDVNG